MTTKSLLARVLQLRDHGRAPGDRMFFNAEVGFKYKMSSMQAALGLAQLERIDELVEGKRPYLLVVPPGVRRLEPRPSQSGRRRASTIHTGCLLWYSIPMPESARKS